MSTSNYTTNSTPVSTPIDTTHYGAAQATLDIRGAGIPAWMVVVMTRKAYVEAGRDGAKYRASIAEQIAAYIELKAITDAKNAAKLQAILTASAVR